MLLAVHLAAPEGIRPRSSLRGTGFSCKNLTAAHSRGLLTTSCSHVIQEPEENHVHRSSPLGLFQAKMGVFWLWRRVVSLQQPRRHQSSSSPPSDPQIPLILSHSNPAYSLVLLPNVFCFLQLIGIAYFSSRCALHGLGLIAHVFLRPPVAPCTLPGPLQLRMWAS